jgi:hypothetical protein
MPPHAAAAHRSEEGWYVTNGVLALGPLSYSDVVQQLATGRIPKSAFIRHGSWNVWRQVQDLRSLNGLDLDHTVHELAELSLRIDSRARGPESEPPPPPSREKLRSGPNSAPPSRQPPSMRPRSVDPVGVMAQAEHLHDALSFALSTAVAAASAEVGLLHRYRPDLGCAVALFGQGVGSERLLGERVMPGDPVLAAALAGVTVMPEPDLGEAGRYLLGRLGRCTSSAPEGMAMVPLCRRGQLEIMLELARPEPFRARDIARAEDVLQALLERGTVLGWFG